MDVVLTTHSPITFDQMCFRNVADNYTLMSDTSETLRTGDAVRALWENTLDSCKPGIVAFERR